MSDEQTILELKLKIEELEATNYKLARWRCEQDCCYTMGDVADVGGRHCPIGKMCERCQRDHTEERLRGEIFHLKSALKNTRHGD